MANPWEMDWSQPQAPQGGLEAVPLPGRPPAPRDPAQVRLDDLRAREIEQRLSKPDAPKANADAVKLQQKRASLQSLEEQINRVEQLYRGGLKDEALGVISSLGDYLPTPENRQFDAASAGLAEQGLSAFRVPGAGAQSDTELRQFVQANRPAASDYDTTIEEKLRQLRGRVDATRQEMGLKPAKWLGAESEDQDLSGQPVPATTVPVPPGIGDAGGGPGGNGPPGLSYDPSGNVIHEDRSRGVMQGNDTGLIGLDGGTHTEVNPALAGANAKLNDLLKRGAPDSAFIAYLQSKGAANPAILDIMGKVRSIKAFQKANPGYKGDFNVDIERVEVPNSGWENFANSDLGVGLASGLDAGTGFNTDSIIGMTGGDADEARQAMAAAQAAHPKSATAGTIAGGVGSALALEGLAAKAGLKGLPRTIAADVTYGGTAGAGATDYAEDGSPATAADRALGAVKGAGAATAGGLAGQVVAGVGRSVARGSKNPYVASINAEGVPTTVGQQYTGKLGGIIKRTEDRIAGLPIIGDIINARRIEGITKWNEKVFDRTLEPIGVKSGGKVGEEAIDYAQDQISEAFTKALKGKAVRADAELDRELTNAVADVWELPRVGDEVADNVRIILEPYMKGGTLSGEAMQQISRELRDLKASYFSANEPMKKRIGGAIDKVEDAIFGPFRRQAPEVLPAYDKAKLAQRRLYIVADAVNAAKNREGIFMPSQLGQADRRGTIKTEGKVSAARGRGQFHDMQRAAQEVLPSKIPDSGTAGRVVIPAVALGAGGTSDATGMTNGAGTTLAGLLALAYTRAGQRALTKPGRGMKGRTGKMLQSDRTRKLLTASGAASGAGLATQQ